MHLYETLKEQSLAWRNANYLSDKYPAIAEILLFSKKDGALKFLREPQFAALEVYWFLRLVLGTPRLFDLYRDTFKNPIELLNAFGVRTTDPNFLKLLFEGEKFWDKVRNDDNFAKAHQLESLRESMELEYPSYILALAMGAGKTILIGTIIATEFALAQEYPGGSFMKNALVFAPGTTIIESLKEISEIPFEKILPPRFYRQFMANFKLTYTSNGDPNIPVESGGLFNLIVTNTEKIMLKKISKNKKQTRFEFKKKQQQEELQANLRLQKIASLPCLGIFSDEAHHTYGQKLGEDLKRVRSTINYLHEKKDLVCVINTTGTPYYKSQTLKDVTFWYSLSEGIKDNILKSLEGGVRSYDFSGGSIEEMIDDIIDHFFKKYWKVRLPNGCRSKIAFYFPSEEALTEARPLIEKALIKRRQPAAVVLKNTQRSSKQEIDNFNALNDPASLFRVMLLVGKGTEGWNCPSLFATALIRKLKGSNNFLLQAGTRCLRQVPGNNLTATIYLDNQNYNTLDNELKETYGSKLVELNATKAETASMRLLVRKIEIPPLVIKKKVPKVVALDQKQKEIRLAKPSSKEKSQIFVTTYNPVLTGGNRVLQSIAEAPEVIESEKALDIYSAATQIASNYHLDHMSILKILKVLYDSEVPLSHIEELFVQTEKQLKNYRIEEEIIEEALAIIRLQDNEGRALFNKDTSGDYYTEIRYTKGNDCYFVRHEDKKTFNINDFAFHYTPYNFDSLPEKDFFENLLHWVNEKPEDIEDIYFTGSITDQNKTDFYFEYKGVDDRYHNYFPDFLIRKKSGKYYIVEIKAENERTDPVNGEKGLKKTKMDELLKLNKDKFSYEIVFVQGEMIPENRLTKIKKFISN